MLSEREKKNTLIVIKKEEEEEEEENEQIHYSFWLRHFLLLYGFTQFSISPKLVIVLLLVYAEEERQNMSSDKVN